MGHLRRVLLWLHCLAFTLPGAQADDVVPARSNRFRMTIDSDMELTIQQQKQSINADTEIDYSWTQRGGIRELTLHSVSVKATQDGRVVQDFTQSRKQFTELVDGKRTSTSFDDAGDDLKLVLRDTYETPLCAVSVDTKGLALKRKMMARPGAATLVDAGMIENALLFHPPCPEGELEWTHEVQFSMGFGGFVTGELKYARRADAEVPGQVSVNGVLLFDGEHKLGIPAKITRAKYVISGTQVHDQQVGEWISGEWTVDASITMVIQDKVPGVGTGTMKLRHERIVTD